MLEFLATQPILLLALLILLGSALGAVRVASSGLGPAGVLFAAMALTGWAASKGIQLEIPEILGSFGLVLFTYSVGITSGPSFFGSLRRGWPIMLSSVCCLAVVAAIGGFAGRALGLSAPMVAGTFAGALNNTPALAAVSKAAGDAQTPSMGYSISYLWGVIGMLLAAAWALGRPRAVGPGLPQLEQRTIRVDHSASVSIAALQARHHDAVSFSRIRHRNVPGVTVVAAPGELLQVGDLVSAVGPAGLLDTVTTELGHASSYDLIGDRTHLDSSRVTLSQSSLAGLRLIDLGLAERFGAQVSRIRRGDVDLIATPGFTVQSGDQLLVVAPRDHLRAIRAHLGDSERGFSDINPPGLTLGLTVGVLIGLVQLPLPGGGFSVGSATGTLLAGLVFGRLGRVGRVVTSMPTAAAHSLSNLGMLVFLAYAGTRAGAGVGDTFNSDLGWRIALLGFLITTLAAVALIATSRGLHQIRSSQLAGHLGGAQTQLAVLAFVNAKTDFDPRAGVSYALVYPAAMVAKIVLAQVLVALGGA